jgi:hypothetical protein
VLEENKSRNIYVETKYFKHIYYLGYSSGVREGVFSWKPIMAAFVNAGE